MQRYQEEDEDGADSSDGEKCPAVAYAEAATAVASVSMIVSVARKLLRNGRNAVDT